MSEDVDSPYPPYEEEGFDIDKKDFVALYIALLQTIFLPILLIGGILLVLALVMGMLGNR